MYQWRKFEFFEEKFSGKVADDITGKIQCCSSGKGRIVLGCDDGSASLLDRGLKFNYGFQAHSSSVLFLQQLKQRNFLVTVGEDEQISPQSSAVCLKIFDLDKMEPEGTSTSTPDCIQILRIFTNQFPEAKITSFLVLEEAPPLLLIAIGLDNGSIYCIQGDIARERIKRFKLQVDNHSDKSQSSISGLGFRVDGQTLQLFAVTPNSVNLFNMHTQSPTRQTLDQIGSSVTSVAMTDRSEFIIGRPEAIYFYEVDGRGPCWAFEGEKKFLGWFRGYLLCVFADQRTGNNTFNVYDLKNRLIAHSIVVKEVSQMLCEWGNIILILEDKSTLCIGEKDMESKLDMLFKKNLYTVAINLVQSQQADAAATAEVLRKYGDHLYSKQDFDEAMAQYIHTIGHLEPSYVIQKFLDAQRIHNLTNYLEKLHEKGLASKDHTTLLLNCYTKLKDVEKLNEFIKSEDGVGEQKFDVETAIRVCRAANYHEHAMSVAKKAGRHEWYLKILLEDLGRYEEALQYISSLELSQAGVTVKEYGKILIEHKPAETVEILMRLCTEETELPKKGTSSSAFISMLPSPIDFLNIFVHYPQALLEFLEKYTIKVKDSSAQVEIHNTLLELYFSHDLDFPSISQSNIDESGNDLAHKPLKAVSNGRAILVKKDVNDEKGRQERRGKGLTLLKSAWPSELEQPLYDVDLAIILCEMNDFKEGLLFLYEKMKLYKEVIACYMQVHDHEGLIACCKRLSDLGKGGDSSLWADLLKYFGELGEDCSKEVKEILTYIERDDILPPIVVLQTLAKNPCLTLSVIKDYIARKLERESQLIDEDRRAIEKYQEESSTMRKEIQDLRTNARIFQLSKCTACTFTLDLPAVHFMCMHSFHQRCLGVSTYLLSIYFSLMAEEKLASNNGVHSQPQIASIRDFDPPKKPKTNKYAIACSFLASLASILLGYDIGVMSGAIIYIQKDLHITDIQVEILVGILNVYSLFGSAAAGRTSDWIGRRYTMVVAAAIFFAGALLMGFATTYAFLMVGRFVAGVGVGYALMVAPVYTAEVSPASSRGFLTSFPEVFINGGILLGYVSNFAFSRLPTHLSWRFMLGIGAVPSVFLAVSVLAMPESPRWLVMQGRLGDARRVLNKTSDSLEEAQLRLADIKEAAGLPEHCNDDIVEVPKRPKGDNVWRELIFSPTPAVRHILLTGVGIHFFQQASGIDAVVLYSPRIFEKAGIKSDHDKLLATVAVGFVKTIFILVATFMLDKSGRRPLLLTSVAGMVLSLMLLATGLTIIDQSEQKVVWAIALSITMVLAYVALFSIGMGPITWVYSSEIFPLRLRATGCSIGVAVNRVTSGVVSMTFLSLEKAITIGGAFFLYAGLAAVAFVFFFTLMPETQGKTLEEMEALFGTFWNWRKTARELKEAKITEKTEKNSNDNGQIQMGIAPAISS